MSFDVYLTATMPTTVFEANVTHNLGALAEAAGIYKHLWMPEELGITKAGDLIQPLHEAIIKMRADPEKFIALNPSNGWGTYEGFLPWCVRYLEACQAFPDAEVRVSR